jgi:hypothetical protein
MPLLWNIVSSQYLKSIYTTKPGYGTPCVANLTEEKSCVCMSQFPTGIQYRKYLENRI